MIASTETWDDVQLREFTVNADSCDIIGGGSIYQFSARPKKEKIPGRWDIVASYPVKYTIIESIIED